MYLWKNRESRRAWEVAAPKAPEKKGPKLKVQLADATNVGGLYSERRGLPRNAWLYKNIQYKYTCTFMYLSLYILYITCIYTHTDTLTHTYILFRMACSHCRDPTANATTDQQAARGFSLQSPMLYKGTCGLELSNKNKQKHKASRDRRGG